MEFVTLDMEIADRIYPALCSICLIKWKDGKIETTYSSLINPELEIEPFMEEHPEFVW